MIPDRQKHKMHFACPRFSLRCFAVSVERERQKKLERRRLIISFLKPMGREAQDDSIWEEALELRAACFQPLSAVFCGGSQVFLGQESLEGRGGKKALLHLDVTLHYRPLARALSVLGILYYTLITFGT